MDEGDLVTTPGASNQIRSVDRGRDLVWCNCRTLPAVDLDPRLHTRTGAVDIKVTQRISTVEGFSLFFLGFSCFATATHGGTRLPKYSPVCFNMN
jgi:hypothetical protein